MLKQITIISFILSVTILNAQNRNNISLNIGEKYLTDWKGRYGIEYGLMYSHIFKRNISSSFSINNYYYERSELQLPPQGYIQRKSYLEATLSVGYNYIPRNIKLTMQGEAGVVYRIRSETIVVGSGITTGGWAEVLLNTYSDGDIGASFTLRTIYLLCSKVSCGIFVQGKVFPHEIYIIYPEGIPHASPDEISYGLSFGINF